MMMGMATYRSGSK